MKKISLILLMILISSVTSAWAAEARFMAYPDIYRDKIVFVYEGNLWLTTDSGGTAPSARGGTAQRLTSFPGMANAPKFSPDGKWIAFSADYDGQPSVYLVPAGGGEPRRLTWQPGNLQAVAWTPDGKRVVFRADTEQFIYRDPNLYAVALDGTAPERLPIDRGTLCSFNRDGSQMFFTRKGNEEYQWKRYKGGQHTDIWHYDFARRLFTPVSDYTGKNAYPMWVNDSLYFVSDREGGIANIYVQDIKTKAVTRVTRHEKYDVMMPETDGERIVYVQDGYLHLLALKDGTTRKLPLELPSDRWRLRSRWINPKGYIHSMDVANDGKNALLEARGDVFLLPTRKGLGPIDVGRSDGPQPDPDARVAGDPPAPLARRPVAGFFLRYERRIPALHAQGRGRRVDPAHPDAGPRRVPAGLVARRQEDPLRQQGPGRLLLRRREKAPDPDRRGAPAQERRVHLGDRRLLLVPGQPLGLLHHGGPQPQQPGLPVQPGPGEKDHGHRRFLQQPQPLLRRQRRVSLLPLQPQLRRAHGLLRGQPRHRHPFPGDGRAAARRAKAAVRGRGRGKAGA